METTKPKVPAEYEHKRAMGIYPELFLIRASGYGFYNTSLLDLKKLMGDQDNIREKWMLNLARKKRRCKS